MSNHSKQLGILKSTWCQMLALISIGVFSLTGCNGQSPAEAEREVKDASKRVAQIDSSLLNQWFVEKNLYGKSLPRESVVRVSGQVVDKNVKEVKKNGSLVDSESELVVFLILPEYAAVVLECRFHTTHVEQVNSLKVGSQVTLKGKLDGTSTSKGCGSVILNGCILESVGYPPEKRPVQNPRF